MSAILREDPPDLSETNKTVSPALERVVRHCLEKNPAERFHSARDLAFAIESLSGSAISSGQTATVPTITATESRGAGGLSRLFSNARVAWIVTAALALSLLAVLGLLYFNRSSTDTRAARLSFNPPPELAFNDTQPNAALISPDGQKIAFTATSADGKTMLYVRSLDSAEAKVLPLTRRMRRAITRSMSSHFLRTANWVRTKCGSREQAADFRYGAATEANSFCRIGRFDDVFHRKNRWS